MSDSSGLSRLNEVSIRSIQGWTQYMPIYYGDSLSFGLVLLQDPRTSRAACGRYIRIGLRVDTSRSAP